jgi:hypothetical protein
VVIVLGIFKKIKPTMSLSGEFLAQNKTPKVEAPFSALTITRKASVLTI